MGASGVDTFDDDYAADWLGDFLEAPSEAAIYRALECAQPHSEAGVAAQGLAAAEVVAALRGAPSASLQRTLDRRNSTLSMRTTPRLERIALDAVDNIATTSELRELWEETDGGLPSWLGALADLRSRLASPMSSQS